MHYSLYPRWDLSQSLLVHESPGSILDILDCRAWSNKPNWHLNQNLSRIPEANKRVKLKSYWVSSKSIHCRFDNIKRKNGILADKSENQLGIVDLAN